MTWQNVIHPLLEWILCKLSLLIWSLRHFILSSHLFRLHHKTVEQAKLEMRAAVNQMWVGRVLGERERKKCAKKSCKNCPRCEMGGSKKINLGHTNIFGYYWCQVDQVSWFEKTLSHLRSVKDLTSFVSTHFFAETLAPLWQYLQRSALKVKTIWSHSDPVKYGGKQENNVICQCKRNFGQILGIDSIPHQSKMCRIIRGNLAEVCKTSKKFSRNLLFLPNKIEECGCIHASILELKPFMKYCRCKHVLI